MRTSDARRRPEPHPAGGPEAGIEALAASPPGWGSGAPEASGLTHIGPGGEARMVDVGGKPETLREAEASCRVRMSPATLSLLLQGGLPKGDALAVARIAGITGAKKASLLVPLAHPVRLSSVDVEFRFAPESGEVEVRVVARAVDRTGVEMEAMVGAAAAALALYDMVKGVERGVVVQDLRLLRKSGGRSGTWVREEP